MKTAGDCVSGMTQAQLQSWGVVYLERSVVVLLPVLVARGSQPCDTVMDQYANNRNS